MFQMGDGSQRFRPLDVPELQTPCGEISAAAKKFLSPACRNDFGVRGSKRFADFRYGCGRMCSVIV